jgi:uncharacterized protein (DUF2126 family)
MVNWNNEMLLITAFDAPDSKKNRNYSAYKTVSVSICHKFSINFSNFRPATEDTIIIFSSSVADFDIGSRYQPT